AHNIYGNNIHCEGAFESQIISPSAIHSGDFVEQPGGGYEASPLNVYGYVYVGPGQGTHALLGGHGVYLENAKLINIIGLRANNHNADGIHVGENCSNIILSNGLVVGNNMT